MSVYDDNAILKDMLLVHEALEEVEELSYGKIHSTAQNASKSTIKHAAKSIFYDLTGNKEKSAAEYAKAKSRFAQRQRLDAYRDRKEQRDAEKAGASTKLATAESFEDIYNSIL